MARDAVRVFESKLQGLSLQLKNALGIAALKLRKRIQDKNLSGRGRSKIGRISERSGNLKNSVIVVDPPDAGDEIQKDIRITARYASVHIGQLGQETRITARGKALTIPTRFAKDSRGVPLGPADSGRFRDTVVRNGKIFGQVSGQSGEVPLFTLKNSVVVPVRVDIQQHILRPALPQIKRDLAQAVKDF